jgi:hypothetical protein
LFGAFCGCRRPPPWENHFIHFLYCSVLS